MGISSYCSDHFHALEQQRLSLEESIKQLRAMHGRDALQAMEEERKRMEELLHELKTTMDRLQGSNEVQHDTKLLEESLNPPSGLQVNAQHIDQIYAILFS
ncbi:unnamed protein product [Darwinula stevensoni]|uniref:Uncharacterized protein n=1 Tax=Darwinula stevensoni TaxID=69355 RepID=A0A7R9AGG6_9CRUS|nr:unnamed protein product [Darwinula stevensoni]CAG0903896.1 unnamed protein product [Darwinula stevensoni]